MKLKDSDIYLDINLKDKIDVINFIGNKMVEKNYVSEEYISSMIKRDEKISVAIGNLLAIPHCEDDAREFVRDGGMVFIKLSKQIDWSGEPVKFVIGLGLAGENQIEVLQDIAIAFSDIDEVNKLYKKAKNEKDVLNFIYNN